MSYRAFKRLLGETSLERKCRFLFGAFILLLMTGSFWLYANKTEDLAYNQLESTSRLLVDPIVAQKISVSCHIKEDTEEEEQRKKAIREFQVTRKNLLGDILDLSKDDAEKRRYLEYWLRPNTTDPLKRPETASDYQQLKEFQEDGSKHEANRLLPSQGQNEYYWAIRASPSCVDCHRRLNADLKENDLIAVVKISIPTKEIQDRVIWNRAILITTALGAAVLIMFGSYLIVRYVIVKPVKHLKEVSDAISAGELNVRSEIQTGDEFEDLSHAFNRMLRSLVSMQDRLRKVNTDLDRKVDELAQANMALYESNRLKSDFLATMSHELRTPLNSILGFSEVLLSANQLSDKQQRWVRNIQSSGERLLNLINDILDLAKIEAGKMQVRLAAFSLYDVCEGLVAMFRPLAEKKNIELRAQMEPGIPVLRQDVVKLQQILSNLLSNALKFTPEGGRVLLQVDAGPGCVMLTVADTGVGIAADEQELIFEKFRQGGNPLTREHAGTGLGLSIVRELSKLLGGEVSLQSELGRGSTFTVRLPLQLSGEPRLEFDLAHEGVDLAKAQRVDLRLYSGNAPGPTRLETGGETHLEVSRPPSASSGFGLALPNDRTELPAKTQQAAGPSEKGPAA
jgi:signal transduction histidine kinase